MFPHLGIEEILRVLRRDLWTYRKPLSLVIAVVLVALPLVGVRMSPTYISATSIYVEEKNILGSLMAGAAVQTEVVDRARIAREIIYGRRLMTEILERNGWAQDIVDPKRREKLVEQLVSQTDIANRGKNLIRIEYRDNDPQRAFNVARDLAGLFITESHVAKIRESEAAFEFIDRQVKQYQAKLDQAEERLKVFRGTHDTARPGAETEVGRRIADLKTRNETIEQELREARIRAQTLERQLSDSSAGRSLPPELRAKQQQLNALRKQYEDLRLNYTDTYPDVVRAKRQIDELEGEISRDRARAQKRRADGNNRPDAGAALDTVYGDIQRELFAARASIETLESRLQDSKQKLAQEIARSKAIGDAEGKLVELERDYSVNHEIHKDLLKRREIARVSMDLARERQGLTLRVDQPAYFPHRPSGLQATHLMLAAPLFALLMPIGLILALNQFDWRARHGPVLADLLQIDEVVTIPHFQTELDVKDDRAVTRYSLVTLIVGGASYVILLAWTLIAEMLG